MIQRTKLLAATRKALASAQQYWNEAGEEGITGEEQGILKDLYQESLQQVITRINTLITACRNSAAQSYLGQTAVRKGLLKAAEDLAEVSLIVDEILSGETEDLEEFHLQQAQVKLGAITFNLN